MRTTAALLPCLGALLVIGIVWQLVVTITQPRESLLPPPLTMIATFADLVVSGELFRHRWPV